MSSNFFTFGIGFTLSGSLGYYALDASLFHYPYVVLHRTKNCISITGVFEVTTQPSLILTETPCYR